MNVCIFHKSQHHSHSDHLTGAAFLTICGGMLPAQLAGVLVDHTCTAPRLIVPILQKQDPRTTWVEKRAHRSGKVWTSGTLLNGLDLMREFAMATWPDLAKVSVPMGGWPERSLDFEFEEVGLKKDFVWSLPQQ